MLMIGCRLFVVGNVWLGMSWMLSLFCYYVLVVDSWCVLICIVFPVVNDVVVMTC